MTGMAPWVVDHWLSYWFSVRHIGTRGHTAEQCRSHARYYAALRRAQKGEP